MGKGNWCSSGDGMLRKKGASLWGGGAVQTSALGSVVGSSLIENGGKHS